MGCIERKKKLIELERIRDSKVLVYVTGDRPNWGTQIHNEVIHFFADHLDCFNLPHKITLYLYSRGGETLAAWSIANLIRMFCDDFEVIIPSKAHSSATLISISANHIVMTKQAQLGPIDPSTNDPLNPPLPGAPPQARIPLSVENVAGYFELAKSEFKIESEETFKDIFLRLSDMVHPVALGKVYRTRTQIQQLARKLLSNVVDEDDIVDRIVAKLCCESGSHDYTINRREAAEMGLSIEKPDDVLYNLVKDIFVDIRQELCLDKSGLLQFDANGNAKLKRALIESVDGGSHGFETHLQAVQQPGMHPPGAPIPNIPNPGAQPAKLIFEGWKHEQC